MSALSHTDCQKLWLPPVSDTFFFGCVVVGFMLGNGVADLVDSLSGLLFLAMVTATTQVHLFSNPTSYSSPPCPNVRPTIIHHGADNLVLKLWYNIVGLLFFTVSM